MTPNQQAQLRQSQQARQAGKPAMQDELEQIIVYQAAKMRELEQQLIQANTAVMQLRAVLENSEQVSQQRAAEVTSLNSDLELLFKYIKRFPFPSDAPLADVVKLAREYAEAPKLAEVVMDASPAPAPQTPAEVPA